MAMNHAREAEVDVEIACARDGTILALPKRSGVLPYAQVSLREARGQELPAAVRAAR